MTKFDLLLLAGAHQAFALAAFALALGVVVGYARLLPEVRGRQRDFAVSHVVVFSVYALRSLYWSVRSIYFADNPVEALMRSGIVNIPLDLCMVVGAFFALRAMHRMIPALHRSRWRWWNAPLYPAASWPTPVARMLPQG